MDAMMATITSIISHATIVLFKYLSSSTNSSPMIQAKENVDIT